MNDKQAHHETSTPEELTNHPRAFVSGTGLVFQTVGAVFALGACGFWSLSGHLEPLTRVEIESWRDLLTPEHAGIAALAAGLLTTFVGGIAIGAIGIGLTGHTRRSGVLGSIVTACMTTIYLVITCVLAWDRGISVGTCVGCAFAMVGAGLLAMTAHSASLLRRFPPPPNQHKATKAFLDEHERQRRERIRRESL